MAGVDLLAMGVESSVGVVALADLLTATHTDAVLGWHRDELVLEHYCDPGTATARHGLYSITKSFVGALAGVLIQTGRLDPSRLATDYVPELGAGGYAPARVRDLLDMRTGGNQVERHDDLEGELQLMGEIAGWLPRTGRPLPVGVRDHLATAPLVAKVGGPFSYRSADTEALAWVLERAGAAPVAQLLQRKVFHPLQLEEEPYLLVDANGDPVASGGLSMRPRDVLRFGRMLLRSGAVGRRQLLPATFIRDIRNGDDDSVEAFRARAGRLTGPVDAERVTDIYRNQFWVPRRGGRQLLCLGVHGQAMLVDPDNDAVVLKLSSWPVPQHLDLFSDGLVAVAAAAVGVGGVPSVAPSMLV